MGELLIWLIILGVIAVVAVYVYNRIEEVRFRRRAEGAFAAQDGDALMDDELAQAAPGERIEPQLQADAAAETPGPADRREPRAIDEPTPAPRSAPLPTPAAAIEALKPSVSAARAVADAHAAQNPAANAAPAARRPPPPQRQPAESPLDPIVYGAEIYAR